MTDRPLAIKYGRRPVYLTSNFLMGMACIWLAIAAEKTYVPFIIGRAFLGLFEAPIEAIVPSTVTDIFHLHERGEKISVYGLGVLGGNEIGPLVSAYIIQTLSVRWAFFIVAISIFINMFTLIFFMPETKFTGPRPMILPPEADDGRVTQTHTTSSEKATSDHFEESISAHTMEEVTIPKKSYFSSLAFCAGVDHTVNLRKTFLRPFVLMSYPTVLWSSTIYGLSLGWNVILGVSVAQLFAPPPYNFTSGDQGLIFLSPFIGSLAGTYLCGPLADQIANWATKRNHGIREPEMRLPACLIAVGLTFFGALMASLSYRAKTHWAGPIVGFGVLSAGAQMGATLAMAYSLDCHKEVQCPSSLMRPPFSVLALIVTSFLVSSWSRSLASSPSSLGFGRG